MQNIPTHSSHILRRLIHLGLIQIKMSLTNVYHLFIFIFILAENTRQVSSFISFYWYNQLRVVVWLQKFIFVFFSLQYVSLMPFVNLPLFIGFSSSYSIDCKEESPIIMRNLFQMSSKSWSEMCFYSLHCGRQCQKWEKAFCGHCHNNLKCYCCYGIEYGELVTDVLNLQQHCLTCKAHFVPRHILNTIYG